jgi:potassium channel subfamily K protein
MELRDKIKQTRDKLQLKYNFTKDDFNRLETTIIKSIMFRGGLKWNFLGSLFFSIIVITTIGYGHSTPNSFLGKLFYIIFALFGIPLGSVFLNKLQRMLFLGLITFQSTGERLNYGLRCFLVKLRSLLAKFGINMLQDIKARHLLVLSLTLGTLIIAIGTIVFHKKETWCLFDSFYFCVITCKYFKVKQ